MPFRGTPTAQAGDHTQRSNGHQRQVQMAASGHTAVAADTRSTVEATDTLRPRGRRAVYYGWPRGVRWVAGRSLIEASFAAIPAAISASTFLSDNEYRAVIPVAELELRE